LGMLTHIFCLENLTCALKAQVNELNMQIVY